MRLYEDIATKYKYHGVIRGIGIHGNVYANTFIDLKRKASEIANLYRRSFDVLEIWNSNSHDMKPICILHRSNIKTPWNTFQAGKWN